MQSPQGIEDMGEDDARKSREGILGDAHYIMGHIDAYQVQSLESEMVGETNAEVVLVWISETKWSKLYFDPVSHMLLKQASPEKRRSVVVTSKSRRKKVRRKTKLQ